MRPGESVDPGPEDLSVNGLGATSVLITQVLDFLGADFHVGFCNRHHVINRSVRGKLSYGAVVQCPVPSGCHDLSRKDVYYFIYIQSKQR